MDNLNSEKIRKIDDSKVVNSSRNPRCAHCRNHGVQTTLKGHKAYCPYRNCNCGLCQLVRMRQKVMAKNVALRRRQELDKMKMQEIMNKNNSITDSCGITSKMSSDRDGDKSNSDPESESSISTRASEGTHISALALIILNFYNNDPKIAMDSIKKVASELSSLIHGDPITSESSQTLQHIESDHLNSDMEKIATTGSSGMFPYRVSSVFNSSSKKIILPATPSMYLSPFHPLALKTYRSTLAQLPHVASTSRKFDPENEAQCDLKVEPQASIVRESPFSIKSLTSEQVKSKSTVKPNHSEQSSSIAPFFGMPSHLRTVGAFAFPQPQQPFACVPFPSFHGFPPSIWSKNWCRRDHNIDLLPTHNPF